jgi:recombination protein RecR
VTIAPFDRLTRLLGRLPGIGEKSAERLAFALGNEPQDYLDALSTAIKRAGTSARECSVCCDLTSQETCEICSDARRDRTAICVVARPQDRMAFERSAVWRGLYHVLHGVLGPLAGVGPEEIRIRALLHRLADVAIKEVVIATSPTVEGDATAIYIAQLINPLGINVTRIASGVAVGGDLEHADMSTLSRALADRRSIEP